MMKTLHSLFATTLFSLVCAAAAPVAFGQSRECTDSPALFSDDGYRGRSLLVTESIADLHRLGMGDDASSICVPYGWRVVLYEDDNYRGDFLELRGQTAIADLKRDRPEGENWGDRISSVKVFRPAPTRRGRFIDCSRPTLYSNDGFGGRTLTLQDSEPNLHRLGMGDAASSLCVPSGWSVVFYEDANYRGDSLNVKGPTSIADLKRDRPDGRNWGDRISSARVVRPYGSRPPERNTPSPYPGGGGLVACSQYPVLYEHDNFRGRTLNLNRSISDLHGRYWGDQASSVCVPRGWRVVLYEDPDYRGAWETIEGPRNVSLHGGFGGLDSWGDRVSSAEVFPPGRWRSGAGRSFDSRPLSECSSHPALFWDAEYRGQRLRVDASQPDLHRLGWGDEASSICVPSGWRVILYEDTNYRGAAWEINGWGEVANFAVDAPDGKDWNDRVSSVRVDRPWQR